MKRRLVGKAAGQHGVAVIRGGDEIRECREEAFPEDPANPYLEPGRRDSIGHRFVHARSVEADRTTTRPPDRMIRQADGELTCEVLN